MEGQEQSRGLGVCVCWGKETDWDKAICTRSKLNCQVQYNTKWNYFMAADKIKRD